MIIKLYTNLEYMIQFLNGDIDTVDVYKNCRSNHTDVQVKINLTDYEIKYKGFIFGEECIELSKRKIWPP